MTIPPPVFYGKHAAERVACTPWVPVGLFWHRRRRRRRFLDRMELMAENVLLRDDDDITADGIFNFSFVWVTTMTTTTTTATSMRLNWWKVPNQPTYVLFSLSQRSRLSCRFWPGGLFPFRLLIPIPLLVKHAPRDSHSANKVVTSCRSSCATVWCGTSCLSWTPTLSRDLESIHLTQPGRSVLVERFQKWFIVYIEGPTIDFIAAASVQEYLYSNQQVKHWKM